MPRELLLVHGTKEKKRWERKNIRLAMRQQQQQQQGLQNGATHTTNIDEDDDMDDDDDDMKSMRGVDDVAGVASDTGLIASPAPFDPPRSVSAYVGERGWRMEDIVQGPGVKNEQFTAALSAVALLQKEAELTLLRASPEHAAMADAEVHRLAAAVEDWQVVARNALQSYYGLGAPGAQFAPRMVFPSHWSATSPPSTAAAATPSTTSSPGSSLSRAPSLADISKAVSIGAASSGLFSDPYLSGLDLEDINLDVSHRQESHKAAVTYHFATKVVRVRASRVIADSIGYLHATKMREQQQQQQLQGVTDKNGSNGANIESTSSTFSSSAQLHALAGLQASSSPAASSSSSSSSIHPPSTLAALLRPGGADAAPFAALGLSPPPLTVPGPASSLLAPGPAPSTGAYAVRVYVDNIPTVVWVDDYLPFARAARSPSDGALRSRSYVNATLTSTTSLTLAMPLAEPAWSTVDGLVPLFTHSKDPRDLWPALVEKAYAKLHTSYSATEGGTPVHPLSVLCGSSPDCFLLDKTGPETLGLNLEVMWAKLENIRDRGGVVLASSVEAQVS